ncbi:hypothetical protein EHF33_06390 [Deinococcus psychrotolerans]|uniref:Uncharacterized protein n=1 Tax=Deinococcus psychrotolerans TaxID=2489213 RepID=A0A3G8YIQ9_9DEIO|nr:hypothetical protein [Deinococcus psychrotolerans]AZI42424.1 hypothetical protein EHF33_06390 [Deinococcus psychrotolerans]
MTFGTGDTRLSKVTSLGSPASVHYSRETVLGSRSFKGQTLTAVETRTYSDAQATILTGSSVIYYDVQGATFGAVYAQSFDASGTTTSDVVYSPVPYLPLKLASGSNSTVAFAATATSSAGGFNIRARVDTAYTLSVGAATSVNVLAGSFSACPVTYSAYKLEVTISGIGLLSSTQSNCTFTGTTYAGMPGSVKSDFSKAGCTVGGVGGYAPFSTELISAQVDGKNYP